MNSQSSGCYIIDSEYNIINANDTALNLYPQLEIGKKCYTCLMGLDETCGPCPVANGKKGPSTYTDPIRNISEIVDAVDINIKNHGPCHMLIFSTVENEASFAATLPTSAEELKNLALIKGLTSDYYDVFSVKPKDKSVMVHRLNGKPLDQNSVYVGALSYPEQIEAYISKYVHPEDQTMMREACELSQIQKALQTSESILLHYRVLLDGELHYYFRKIVRIGEPDSFENIVVGIACEDEAVENREKQIALQNTLRKVELNTMTGLLTKEAFFIYSDKLLKNNTEISFDFCCLKIDNLDSIRRQYGTNARTQVVQCVGDVLREYLKDTTCTGYFGDGLFVCIVASQDSDTFHSLTNTFENQVRQKSNIKNIVFKWTLYKQISNEDSNATSSETSSEISLEELFKKITYVLNTLRLNLHNDYIELTHETLAQLDWDISVERNFDNALRNSEFVVWFQPKYSVHTKEIIGAEALVRWINGNNEMIPPNKFIPILENSGLINRLDEEVFRQVCIFQRELADHGMKQLSISVNVSRASIFTRDIPEVYAEIAQSFGVSTSLIPIEITESAAVRASMIGEFAEALIQKGFSLHMDDFGAGYSSLASLQMLPFECIKIDKSLVDFIGKQNGESLLKHTIAFAKESGLHIIAEGVERMEQFLFLKIAGCDAIQGYYFSKPVDRDTFWSMLEKEQNPTITSENTLYETPI